MAPRRGRYSINAKRPEFAEELLRGGRATYVIEPVGSDMVVREIRITQPGPAGITQRDLRHLSPKFAVDEFRRYLEQRQEEAPPAWLRAWPGMAEGLGTPLDDADRRRLADLLEHWHQPTPKWQKAVAKIAGGKTRTRPQRLAVTAAAYVAAVRAGHRNPNEIVARQQYRSVGAVRDDVHAARAEGLLEPSGGRGLPGGGLTPAAEQILLEAEQAP